MSALAAPLDRREQLLPTQAEDATVAPDVEELGSWLLQAESDQLEFKASAFTDIEHAIGNRSSPRARDDQLREIAKAVTGFLNASGGTLVIGVAETDRLDEERLLRRFPGALTVSTRLVLGVDHEFSRGGWDQYQRTLAANLRKQITGEFDGWVKYHDVDYKGLTVCVLKVRRSKGWHYLKSRDRSGTTTWSFYGRAGGETRHLPPPEADQFKEAHPRLSSIDTRGDG
jgi:predicted HTH transcriptional regulator